MTIPQLAVLEALLHLGPLCQRDLGGKMLRSGGSVTTLVDHLERKGWVRRARRAEDRRMIDVELTPAGRRVIERVFPAHVRHLREAFGELTAGEQEELGRLCRKLGLALAAAEGG
jgi:MarR family 2-MHQ and catechol resistance regulon transcriptional repressor